MTPEQATGTADIITALWGAGGGSLGGILLTLLTLRFLGVELGRKNGVEKEGRMDTTIQCPMNPGLATLEEKIDQLIREQIRSNTYLEIMANQLQRRGESGG